MNAATRQPRRFAVTVTPRVVSYAGTWADTGYTVEVIANDRNEAITRARRARVAEEGRLGTPCTYSARLAD